MVTRPAWIINGDYEPEVLGVLPEFLDEEDPAGAREQFAKNYRHGGWSPIKGFTLDGTTLHYPGDPPLRAIAVAMLHARELIVLYQHSLVMVASQGQFEVARLD